MVVKVSVLVPCYNVEKYIKQCLDSIVCQTLKDIEIICINDGSTDSSLDILKDYSKKDDRIKIINQKNKGLGATRNKGIDLARGKYIFFIDSDDYIELDTLFELYNVCEKKELDFVICQVKNYDEKNNEFFTSEYFDMPVLAKTVGDTVFNYNDVKDILPKINVVAWNKLYNLNFIKKINARFSENLIFEDNVFFWNLLFNAKKIYFYQKYFYIYRRRDLSITSSGNKNLIDTIEIHNQIFNVFKENDLFETHKNFLFNKKVSLIYSRFEEISEEYKETFFKEMKNDFIQMVEEYGKDYILDILSERAAMILINIIESNNSLEFQLKNKISQNNIEIKTLTAENKNLKENNEKLKNQLNSYKIKNDSLNKELDLIYSSNSWKLTKPLRKIRNR